MESTITRGEQIGIVETKIVYKKRNRSTRDIGVINIHGSDSREAFFIKADETIDADNVKSAPMKSITQNFEKCSMTTTAFLQAKLAT